MFQLSTPAVSGDAPEVERYRSRQRLLSRGYSPSIAWIEDERRRKTPSKWPQRQQAQTLSVGQIEDGRWPEPAGTEMRVGFNAFDSSASPEAFNQAQQPETQPQACRFCCPCDYRDMNQSQLGSRRHLSSVERAVTSMGFPIQEWAPGLQHPSTLCAYAPLQHEGQHYGLYYHRPRYH